MSFVNITTPNNKKIALLELGFRPFFLAAGLIASVSLILWALMYSGEFSVSNVNYYPAVIWHSHEMVFGYASAVIAGFLLTAVTNWTGQMTIRNWSLASLLGLWVLARVLPFISENAWLIASVDFAFYPLLAIAVAVPIIKTGNHRNLFVIVLLALMAVGNLMVHGSLLKFINVAPAQGLYFALFVQLMLIVVFSGRVFPFFTARGVAKPFEPVNNPRIEEASIACFVGFILGAIFELGDSYLLFFSLLTVIVHSYRLWGWYNAQIWQVPLLWVLHVGYYFIILGVLAIGLATIWPIFKFTGLHALTVGGLGLISLGMMARVSLGHTGRNIHQPPVLVSSMFIMIAIAALIRVFVPIFWPAYYLHAILFSALLWSLGFSLFVIVYAPYLVKSRIDGLPG